MSSVLTRGRLERLANVKAHGAALDGVTDDTAAVLAAAAATTGSIEIPAGNCKCTTAVLAYNQRFDGDGLLQIGADTLPAGKFAYASFTISIPATFPDINSAMGFLDNRVLGDGVVVTLQIANGTYTFEQVFPFHPQGGQIQIIGNQADRTQVTLQFDTTNLGSAFNCGDGYGLRLVDGMTIVGLNGWQSHGVWNAAISPYGSGIIARKGGHIRIGGNVIVQKFYYGIRAEHGGSIEVDAGAWVQEAGDVGIHAIGGHIVALGTYVSDCLDSNFNVGYGYLAELAGSLHAQGSHAWLNNLAGFAAISTGSLWAWNAESHHNVHYGFYATNGGDVDAYSNPPDNMQAVSYSNGSVGVFVQYGGHIEFAGSRSYLNSGDGINCNGGTIIADGAESDQNGGVGICAIQNGIIYGTVNSNSNAYPDYSQTGAILNATHL